jgi:hypothetical protein
MKTGAYDYNLILTNSNFAIDNVKSIRKLVNYKTDSIIKNVNNKSRALFVISNTINLLEEIQEELNKY